MRVTETLEYEGCVGLAHLHSRHGSKVIKCASLQHWEIFPFSHLHVVLFVQNMPLNDANPLLSEKYLLSTDCLCASNWKDLVYVCFYEV